MPTKRRSPKKPARPQTAHHVDAKDCPHPAGARLGDVCAQCGTKVAAKSR